MLPHALPSATWEFQGNRVDQHGKEWFCGRDVCMILGFQDPKKTFQRRVKNAYRSSLELIKFQDALSRNQSLTKKARQSTFLGLACISSYSRRVLQLVDKIHLCYLMHYPVLHGNFREDELISMVKSGFEVRICV